MTAFAAACVAIAERCAAGQLSPQVALMEMLIATEDELAVERELEAHATSSATYAELLRVLVENRAGCAKIARLLRTEQAAETDSVEHTLRYCRQLFDGLVQASEETSVALYSLGSPELLAAATAEVVQTLAAYGVLTAHSRVLDVGCGIGRMCSALSPHVAQIDGIDLAPQMVAAATRRCAGLGNVRIRACSGRDFADFASASKELVLAVDSFPYVVQGGPALVAAIFAEAARVLAPGGHFVLLNYAYREEPSRDREEVTDLAAQHGFHVQVLGELPFRVWNGVAFALRRG